VFRDDLIFFIYLYQRWIYPVDMKRVNEFGQEFEEEEKSKQAVAVFANVPIVEKENIPKIVDRNGVEKKKIE
jgi:hypothetical protein